MCPLATKQTVAGGEYDLPETSPVAASRSRGVSPRTGCVSPEPVHTLLSPAIRPQLELAIFLVSRRTAAPAKQLHALHALCSGLRVPAHDRGAERPPRGGSAAQ